MITLDATLLIDEPEIPLDEQNSSSTTQPEITRRDPNTGKPGFARGDLWHVE